MRRTWSTDITFPDDLLGKVVADVRGRDLFTDFDETAEVRDTLAVTLEIDPATGRIGAVEVTHAGVSLGGLQGIEVRGGYGRRLTELLAHDAARRSLCFSALEDLGGAYLVSGYARLTAGLAGQNPEHVEAAVQMQANVCAGWAADGPFIATMRAQGSTPVPFGPAAPALEVDDPLGWHEMPPFAATTVRRRRRIDVTARADAGDGLRAQEHFRDSYADHDGETVMHEYLVEAAFDGHNRLGSIHVEARVLPWSECPGAVASAQQLVGVPLDELAARVRCDLHGVATCTHLNSTMRALADVRALAASMT